MYGPTLQDYQDKYPHIRVRREDGILEVTLHSDGQELIWGFAPHQELTYLFEDIARDSENKVIILTGTGETFIQKEDLADLTLTAKMWAAGHFDGKRLMMSHLDIQAPMIAAINGPATIHAELAALCDITLAAEHAVIADKAHGPQGLVPGDGVQVVWPALLGLNRARYFLLTGQELSAHEARDLGVINEVLPKDDLLQRAWELARLLRSRPEVAMQLTRTAIVQDLKKKMHDSLGYGLALEAIAGLDYWPSFSSEK